MVLGSFGMCWYIDTENLGEAADIEKPFTASFPHADIHELLAPDLLYQIIKGTFKDHLVEWITLFIDTNFNKSTEVLTELDCQYMALYATTVTYITNSK
jgi:hypothetical protein